MADKVSKFIFPVKNGTQITNKEFDLPSGDTNTFVGTTAEWNALTAEQQSVYNCRVLTDDDLEVVEVIDNLTSDSSTDALSAKQGKVLKGLTDIVQAQVSDSGDAYDSTRAYAIGDLCIYNNVLYRCITACSAGSWATNRSCFTADTLTNAINTTLKKSIDSTYDGSFNNLPIGWVYGGLSCTDKPDNLACFVLTMRHVNGSAAQLAFSRTGRTYTRMFDGTNWISWTQL